MDASLPAKAIRETVTGELSTQPGMEVTVTPYGTIKVKKTGDPLWDDEKDEPFVSGSEEENDEAGPVTIPFFFCPVNNLILDLPCGQINDLSSGGTPATLTRKLLPELGKPRTQSSM